MCGYWTHGGYLNWDTGYGFKRWHAGRTWALAQQGLLAIAASPALPHRARARARWAKYMFDRGLACTSGCRARRPTARASRRRTSTTSTWRRSGPSIRELFAARMQANAARAVALGLGGDAGAASRRRCTRSTRDIGRLDVTTPRYSTAVLPVNQRAFPYGGMELCRLYDGDQRVVSNVGGRPWASFGVLVRDSAPRRSPPRSARRRSPRRSRRCALLSSPRGRVDRGAALSAAPVRRPVRDADRARAAPRSRRGRDRHDPQFTPSLDRDALERSRGGGAALHGRRAVPVVGQDRARRGGAARRPPGDPRAGRAPSGASVSLRDVVVLLPRRRGDRLRRGADRQAPARHGAHPEAEAQSSAPRPGPTLAVQLARGRRFRRLGLAVRIAPAASSGGRAGRAAPAAHPAAQAQPGYQALMGERTEHAAGTFSWARRLHAPTWTAPQRSTEGCWAGATSTPPIGDGAVYRMFQLRRQERGRGCRTAR